MPDDHRREVEFVHGKPITVYVGDKPVKTYKRMSWARKRAARELRKAPHADVLIHHGTTRVTTKIAIGQAPTSGTTRNITQGIRFRLLDGTGVSESTTTRRNINSGIVFRLLDGNGVTKEPVPASRNITQGIEFRLRDGQGVVVTPAPPGTGVATHGKSLISMRLPFADPAGSGAEQLAYMVLANGLGRREGQGSGSAAATRTVRTAFTLSDMVCRVTTNTSDAATTYTIYRNGIATSLSLSVPAATTGEFKNTSASEAFAVGDTVYIEVDRNAHTTGVVEGPIFSCVADYGSTATITPTIAVGGPYNANATREFASLSQFSDWDRWNEAQSQTRVDMDCTAQNAWVYVETNNRTTATDYHLRVNGADTSVTIQVPAGQIGYFEDTANTAAISEGDLLGWGVLGGAETTNIETSQAGIELSATNAGESIQMLEATSDPTLWTLTPFPVVYWPLCGNMRVADEMTAETDARQEARFPCEIDKLSCYVDSNSLTDTSTISLRKQLAAGGSAIDASPVITIASAATGWQTDTTGEVSVYDTLDEFNYQMTGGATGTALTPLRFGARVTYTPPTGGTPGGFDDVAELPRSEPPSEPPDTTGYNVITVHSGGAGDYTTLQAALDDPLILTQNNVIEVQSGQTFTATSQPRRGKTGAFWTVIRPTGVASLSGRVDPSDSASMFKLECPLSGTTWNPCLNFQSAADRYWIIGAEITVPDDSVNRTRSSMVDCRPNNGGVTSNVADYPTNIGFDRCYIHANLGGSPGERKVTRALTMEAIDFSIVNCYVTCATRGGQGGFMWTTTTGFGPALIENNYNDGNAFFAGGIPNPPIPGKMPTDFTIRGNHFHKSSTYLDGSGGVATLNMLEFKIGERYLIENNIFEGNEADQQSGKGILMRNSNQSGGSGTANLGQDITFRWNLVEDTPSCVDLSAHGSSPTPRTVEPLKRVSMHDNLFVHIGANTDSGGAGQHHQLVMSREPDSWHIFNNTFDDPGSAKDGLCSHSPTVAGSDLLFKDNICWRGAFGWRAFTPNAGEGTASIEAADATCVSGGRWDYNVVVGNAAGPFPGSYPALENIYPQVSGFLTTNMRDPLNGDYRLIVGSRFSSTGTDPGSDGDDRGCDVQTLCGNSYVTPQPGTKLAGVRQAGV